MLVPEVWVSGIQTV